MTPKQKREYAARLDEARIARAQAEDQHEQARAALIAAEQRFRLTAAQCGQARWQLCSVELEPIVVRLPEALKEHLSRANCQEDCELCVALVRRGLRERSKRYSRGYYNTQKGHDVRRKLKELALADAAGEAAPCPEIVSDIKGSGGNG